MPSVKTPDHANLTVSDWALETVDTPNIMKSNKLAVYHLIVKSFTTKSVKTLMFKKSYSIKNRRPADPIPSKTDAETSVYKPISD